MKPLFSRPAVRRFLSDYLPMIAVWIIILIFAVLQKQSPVKVLPTLVTPFVMVLMAHANRVGFLVGGCNAAVYGIVFLAEGLYFSAASSLLFSFPMQIWSFFHWKKHSSEGEVELRFMSPWKTGLTVLSILGGWALSLLFLRPLFDGAVYPELDAYGFVSGIVVTVLFAIRYVEGQYLNLVAILIQLVMWILIVMENPSNTNYLIITLYNLIRTAEGCVRWTVQYRKKQKGST